MMHMTQDALVSLGTVSARDFGGSAEVDRGKDVAEIYEGDNIHGAVYSP